MTGGIQQGVWIRQPSHLQTHLASWQGKRVGYTQRRAQGELGVLMCADPEYLAFVESLDAQPEALPSADAAGSSGQRNGQESGPQVTALMAYLQDKHSIKKKAPVVVVARPRAEAKADRVSLAALSTVQDAVSCGFAENGMNLHSCGVHEEERVGFGGVVVVANARISLSCCWLFNGSSYGSLVSRRYVCALQKRGSDKATAAKDPTDYSRETPRILTKERKVKPDVEESSLDRKPSRRSSKIAAAAATKAQVCLCKLAADRAKNAGSLRGQLQSLQS